MADVIARNYPGPQSPEEQSFLHLCDCRVGEALKRRKFEGKFADHNRRWHQDWHNHPRECAYVKAYSDAWSAYTEERNAWEAECISAIIEGRYSEDAIGLIAWEWGNRYGEISRDVNYLIGLITRERNL